MIWFATRGADLLLVKEATGNTQSLDCEPFKFLRSDKKFKKNEK